MSKTTDLFAASAAALILACVMGNLRYASPYYRPDGGSDRSPHNDDEPKATAHRALRGLFVRVQLSDVTGRAVRPRACQFYLERPAAPSGAAPNAFPKRCSA
jgi:hypothetical protein